MVSFLDYFRRLVMCLIFLQWTHYTGLNLRYRRLRVFPRAKRCRQSLHGFIPLAAVQRDAAPSLLLMLVLVAVAFEKFDFTVLTAGLLHLLDCGIRAQFGFRVLSELAVNSFIVRVPGCQ